MKLTARQIYRMTPVIAAIIRDQRPMPQRGKYALARLHMKLYPEYMLIDQQRDALITAYNFHTKVKDADGKDTEQDDERFTVPSDKEPEFREAEKEMLDHDVDVNVDPIPLKYLDLGVMVNGAIQASELVLLGELVTEE